VRIALATLLLAGLLGCASEEEAFCDEVEAQQERLTEVLTGGGQDSLIRALPSLRALQDKAPGDVRDEYAVVVDAIEGLEAALEEAGIDPAAYDEDDLQDLPDEDEQRVRAAASTLGSRATQTAFRGLEQQARDVCHTPISL